MDKFEEVRFNHIYREDNLEVDQLANKGTNADNILLLANDLDNLVTH